jgi:hypothetical protein
MLRLLKVMASSLPQVEHSPIKSLHCSQPPLVRPSPGSLRGCGQSYTIFRITSYRFSSSFVLVVLLSPSGSLSLDSRQYYQALHHHRCPCTLALNVEIFANHSISLLDPAFHLTTLHGLSLAAWTCSFFYLSFFSSPYM